LFKIENDYFNGISIFTTLKTMKKNNYILAIVLILFSFFFSNCVSVKAYQKMHLNDEEMQLKSRQVETFEMNFESYREGASGANGGKVGGGCGCN